MHATTIDILTEHLLLFLSLQPGPQLVLGGLFFLLLVKIDGLEGGKPFNFALINWDIFHCYQVSPGLDLRTILLEFEIVLTASVEFILRDHLVGPLKVLSKLLWHSIINRLPL